MHNQMELSVADAAWLAGIIDGEGTISVYKDSGRRGAAAFMGRVEVTNTNPLIVLRVCLLTGLKPALDNRSRLHKGHKALFRVRAGGDTAAAIVRTIKPYLVGKAKQAELFLQFHDSKTSGEDPEALQTACTGFRELNLRGA